MMLPNHKAYLLVDLREDVRARIQSSTLELCKNPKHRPLQQESHNAMNQTIIETTTRSILF